MAAQRSSRVFTVSFPEPLAKQVEEIARQESRNISELLRESFRLYRVRAMEKRLDELRPQATTGTPVPTEDEIQSYVDKVREEMYRERTGVR